MQDICWFFLFPLKSRYFIKVTDIKKNIIKILLMAIKRNFQFKIKIPLYLLANPCSLKNCLLQNVTELMTWFTSLKNITWNFLSNGKLYFGGFKFYQWKRSSQVSPKWFEWMHLTLSTPSRYCYKKYQNVYGLNIFIYIRNVCMCPNYAIHW